MSLPSPPTGGPFSTQSSAANSARNSTRYSNGSTISGQSAHKSPNKSTQPLAHIQDLQQRAVDGLDKNQSIHHLITAAENALRQAVTLLEYRKPDLAYTEYLRCYEILVTFIYQNPGFPDFKNGRSPAYSRYNYLIKRLTSREEQFTNVKEIIENDNQRNGTQPRLPASSASSSPKQPATSTPTRPTVSRTPSEYESYVIGRKAISSTPIQQSRSSTNLAANGSSKAAIEGLNERFARLRAGPKLDTSASTIRPQSGDSQASPLTITSPTFNDIRRGSDDMRSPGLGSPRPNGPRPMNGGLSKFPDSISLNAQVVAAMPTPPTPAYSPARNMQISGDMDLPRSSARSIVGTGGRSNSLASSVSAHAPGGDSDSGYFPKAPSNGQPVRRKSVYLPKETRVGAEKLYDYLKMHSVLLIDCRSREEFDNGHVFHNNIMCIEPTALRKDMSADQLQDSLVLSPEEEQDLFASRDQFDLIVYYDAATVSDQYLKNPRTDEDYTLRYLHDALLEFNESKPLQRPPILLMGGIDAWTDLVGNQALKMSNTAQRVKSMRPARRSAVPDLNQRIQSSKRRLRDYNPLDAEEEQKWRERARKESVVVEPRPDIQEEDESATVDDESMLESIAEFNRRFPDAASIGQPTIQEYQQFPRPPPVSKPFEYPVPPSSSAVSTLPTVPARPAPAAPRMSYSGVNERSISQSRSAELPAYVPSHLQPANLRLPKTGLVNFGVTCYMNSTIQALSATLPLSTFFLDDRYKTMVQRDNWKGSKGVLPDLFANLVRSIWNGQVSAIRPSTLRAFCARLNREWGIDRQQDAKEFFDFLLDCLHEDLNKNWSRTPLRALTEEQEIKRESMPKIIVSKTEWDRYTHREQSYLTSLFAGQHASRLKCTVCHFTSTTYEAFYSISVEIPRSGRSTVQECLKSYCQEEMLSGDEVWKCPRCKKQREATKQITITRAPQYLVVHFKRFAAGKHESTKKVRTPIDFPLSDLDLEPYMLPPPSPADRAAFADKDLSQEIATSPPYLYDAYAVMRHIGTTMGSGHYTCLARDRARRCWRQYNDTLVSEVEPERLPERDRLTNEMAYIVFFERKGVR
ncbi:cysteine proteinase [Myriangium duriaei CBS 260.36]|uniref:Cysteine proteinase n=1 Tax=Myriangium duriaei CBS 260.36 TaxID=1168546 RepID=A0A9P4JA03_9PEZI|nr:cysteine proteinase [Myriangium duriaei CBS 260.36]